MTSTSDKSASDGENNNKFLAVCGATIGFVGFLGYKLWKSQRGSNEFIPKISDSDNNDNNNNFVKGITYIPLSELHEFEVRMFMYFGIEKCDAILAADVLCASDLRGIDSHGVARLETYFGKLCKKLINPNPKIKIIRESTTTCTIDGDNGLGLIVANKANDIAINKAIKYGSGFVAVQNSNHYGIAGYYTLKCLEKGCIGISMCNTSPLVAPTFGLERCLGTNPISISFPGEKYDPILIDMATSTVPFGKIEEAERENKQIPDGWCIDKNGNTINNPSDVINKCGLHLPLGSTENGKSYKGYCLSTMVDILCGPLSGANYGKHVVNFSHTGGIQKNAGKRGKGRGHFFGALRIDGFRDLNTFKNHIDKWRQDIYKCKSMPNKQVLVPGDPEWKQQRKRNKTGIPIKYQIVCDIIHIAKYCNIPLPKTLQEKN